MENTSVPKARVSTHKSKLLVAIGLFLMAVMGFAATMMFVAENTLTGREKASYLVVFLAVFLFGLNALLVGIKLIKFRKWTIVALAALIGAVLWGQTDSAPGEKSSNSYFSDLASAINRDAGLPRMDGEMRIERVVANGNTLNFTYTENITAAEAQPAPNALATFVKQQCGTAPVKDVLQHDGLVYITFQGKDGGRIDSAGIMKSTCAGN